MAVVTMANEVVPMATASSVAEKRDRLHGPALVLLEGAVGKLVPVRGQTRPPC